MDAGRPFLNANTAPTLSHAVEMALSDWVGMQTHPSQAGPKDENWEEYVKNIKDPEERAHAHAKYKDKPPPSTYTAAKDEM